MNSISFDNIYLLFLAIPLIAVFAVPFALAIRKENANKHNIGSLIMHVALAVVVAFAAAGTKITRVLTETEVYVVADVSYSAQKNLDTIDNYIRDLGLPVNSKVGLITFGKDYELLSPLTSKSRLKSVKEANVDDSETNIRDALEYAGTLFSDSAIKRIVLITDGKQSDDSSGSLLKQTINGLILKNIKIDAIYLDDNIKEGVKEVQISSVSANDHTYMEKEEAARLSVQSSYNIDALMAVYADGVKVGGDTAIAITEGQNNISFDLFTDKEGKINYKVQLVSELLDNLGADRDDNFDYEVRIAVPDDVSDVNNTITFSQNVHEEFDVLIVSEKWTDVTTLVNQYVENERVNIDVFDYDNTTVARIKNAFISSVSADQVSFFTVNNGLNGDLPKTVESLMKYDEIVLADIVITNLPDPIPFVASLDTVVASYGKSLITMGNLGLQNKLGEMGDADLVPFGNMLPVRFSNNGEEPALYALVIDFSRSMVNTSHYVVARQAASKLIDILSSDDYLTIIAFHGDVEVLLTPSKVGEEEDRQRYKDIVNGKELVQGTMLGKGLSRAAEYLSSFQASNKQVMLITDGLSYTDEEDDPVSVVEGMYEMAIATSVLDVGRIGDNADGSNSNSEYNNAHKRLIEIAEKGHGTYAYSHNRLDLDELTFAEIADPLTKAVIEEETPVIVDRSTDAVLDGLEVTSFPSVMGYVNSTTKASATTVLKVDHKLGTSGRTSQKPLYAYWNYGTGKVATFTSSISENWLSNWSENNLANKFFENILLTNVPARKVEQPLSVAIQRDGKQTRVEVTAAALYASAQLTISITDPSGEKTEGESMVLSGNNYAYELQTLDVGEYTFDIVYHYGQHSYETSATMYIPYLDEYNEFQIFEASALHRAIDGIGTVNESETLKLENDESEIGRITYSLVIPLLIVAVVLFIADIIVRKLKWEDIMSLFGLGKKEAKKK